MMRKANTNELDIVLKILGDGKRYLHEKSIPQWEGDYPEFEIVLGDIEDQDLYLYEENNEINAVVTVTAKGEPAYNTLTDGNWTGESYLTIHRIAVAEGYRRKGVAEKLLVHAYEKACSMGLDSLRTDTKSENIPMTKLLTKSGFKEVGTVEYEDAGKFIAFEKLCERDYGIIYRDFSTLSLGELYSILRLRSDVFVVEQNSVYLDPDGLDKMSTHIFAIQKGEIIGYIRVIPPGIKYGVSAITRVCVSKAHRGNGIGFHLLREAIQYIEDNYEDKRIKIEAQSYLASAYEKEGFTVVGEEYDLDGIMHVDMMRE